MGFHEELYYVFRRQLFSKRLLLVAGVTTGFFAVSILMSESFAYYISNIYGIDLARTTIPVFLLGISVVSLTLVYLQSGGENESSKAVEELRSSIRKEARESNKRLLDAEKRISTLKEQLEANEPKLGLTDEEKQKIIESAIEQTSEESIKEIFSSETLKLQESFKQNLSLERLVRPFEAIIERLQREIRDLRLRSNINLAIGMAITAGGLYLLWLTVDIVDASQLLKQLASEGSESDGKFLKNLVLPLVPRFLLVVFIEIFAYFFLSLYKEGLSEIKYFQNELTNIEAKLVSVEFSYITDQMDSLKAALDELSRTERNFIITKGQTTKEVEKAKYDSELSNNILSSFPQLLKKAIEK